MESIYSPIILRAYGLLWVGTYTYDQKYKFDISAELYLI